MNGLKNKPIPPFAFFLILTPQISLLVFDFVWRTTRIPIESMLTYAAGILLVAAVFIYVQRKNSK